MNRETALRKILACLRLGASANANEAAAALRQARALMDKYGLTEADAHASGIKRETAKTRSRGGELPCSVMRLARLVADGYRCEVVIRRTWGNTVIDFYGAGSDSRIASYAFTVLRRQLELAQAKHTSRIRKAANKEARREAFGRGWVVAVQGLFPKDAPDEDRAVAIDAVIKSDHPTLGVSSGRDVPKSGRSGFNDQLAGYEAGKGAHLHAGVGGAQQARLGADG